MAKVIGVIGWIAGFFMVSGVALSTSTPYAGTADPIEFATTTSSSYNWSGYVSDSGTYTSVSGTWIVPDVDAGQASLAADATWVGVGGVDSRDLIQAGTQSLVDADGEVEYQAWFETLPRASQPVPLAVHAGDSVTVALTYGDNSLWHVTFINNTTGKEYTMDVSYASSLSSAEWIEEMPSLALPRGAGGFIPLANFDKVTFVRGSATVDGMSHALSDLDPAPLKMINRAGETLTRPSVLKNDGFVVEHTNAQPVAVRPVRVVEVQLPL